MSLARLILSTLSTACEMDDNVRGVRVRVKVTCPWFEHERGDHHEYIRTDTKFDYVLPTTDKLYEPETE